MAAAMSGKVPKLRATTTTHAPYVVRHCCYASRAE
jgi:hypothetical protein